MGEKGSKTIILIISHVFSRGKLSMLSRDMGDTKKTQIELLETYNVGDEKYTRYDLQQSKHHREKD